jgi:nucleoside-diphosphate-sugar epimerase
MKKVLITGVAGNIGSALAEHILSTEADIEIVGVDDLSTGTFKNIEYLDSKRLTFVRASCNSVHDMESLFQEHRFKYVFHYAACAGVVRTLESPDLVFQDILGVEIISRLARSTGVSKIAYSSSSEVYGEPASLPLAVGSSAINPRLPYAMVKALGEVYFQTFHESSATPFVNFRFFNTYGPGQSDSYVVRKFLNSALKNEDINIFGDGLQTRTFLYSQDNAEVTWRLMCDPSFLNRTINIGSSEMISILQLAREIIASTGSASVIRHLPARARGDSRLRQPENAEFLRSLGRQPVALPQGIRRVIDSLRRNGSMAFGVSK